MDDQEIIHHDSDEDWEDTEDGKNKTKIEEKMEDEPVVEKLKVWNEQQEPLKEDEELEFDNEAY